MITFDFVSQTHKCNFYINLHAVSVRVNMFVFDQKGGVSHYIFFNLDFKSFKPRKKYQAPGARSIDTGSTLIYNIVNKKNYIP